MEIISEWLPIVLPFIAYIVSGVVMIIKIIGQIKDMAKKSEDDKKETNSEIAELKEQIKIANQENAALRKEMKSLTNAVYHIKEE